jgi:hypothetical protein
MTPHPTAKGGLAVSVITDARTAATRRAGSLARIELPRPAKLARALLWLALDRAADTRSVSRPARLWKRSVSVTLCRASLGLLAVWVFVVVWPGTPHMAGEVDPRPLWAAAPVIAYLLSAGLVIDHFGARYGAAALFGLHLVGATAFLPFMWAIALANPSLDATRFGQSTMTIAAAWPVEFIGIVLLSYGLAWLVPGSLPRQFRFTREAWGVVRDVDSARPHPPLPLTEARSEASVGAWD